MAKKVFITCFKTIIDVLDKDSKYHETSKLFVSLLAKERFQVNVNKSFCGKIGLPVHNSLFDVSHEIYKEKFENTKDKDKSMEDIELLATIFAAFELDGYALSNLDIHESVLELGRDLNDEYEVVIVSNNCEKLKEIKAKLEKTGRIYDFDIITTFKWMEWYTGLINQKKNDQCNK